jgi:hypothetical protein
MIASEQRCLQDRGKRYSGCVIDGEVVGQLPTPGELRAGPSSDQETELSLTVAIWRVPGSFRSILGAVSPYVTVSHFCDESCAWCYYQVTGKLHFVPVNQRIYLRVLHTEESSGIGTKWERGKLPGIWALTIWGWVSMSSFTVARDRSDRPFARRPSTWTTVGKHPADLTGPTAMRLRRHAGRQDPMAREER